jgi:hypothetical protein
MNSHETTVSSSQIAALRGMTLEQVQFHYAAGRLGQDAYEGYAHAWRTGAVRFSSELAGFEDHDSLPLMAQTVAAALGCCKNGE